MKGFEVTGGILYIVGTPIGNLEDITFRAVKVLKEVDVIAAEDTRRTRKLMAYLGLTKPLVAYHDHNAARALPGIIERIEQGEAVALVTDGGMPCISDPGYRLIARCREQGLPATVIPGPSAVVNAIALSGLTSERFVFEGYLPRRSAERERRWQHLAQENRAIVIYEAPHRMHIFLKEIRSFIPDRMVCICREMTKCHEEIIRGTGQELAQDILDSEGSCTLKGEITIVIATKIGKGNDADLSELDWAIRSELGRGLLSNRDVAKKVADENGIPFRKTYKRLLELLKMAK
ncbi:16S rRNA (cytidine(1402)-2'-O)-methyltransferase [bacterium]|nr:16S rRNA (cytidine(1402)-2'-O)-methyltransferase [candidate division CSSED10-310 bacterium]